jgi:hypothetical protein
VYSQEKLDAALRDYATVHRFGHPDLDDFYAAIGRNIGAKAEKQARILFDETGEIDLFIRSVQTAPAPGGHSTRLEIAADSKLKLPVAVVVKCADGSEVRRRIVTGPKTVAISIDHPSPPLAVIIDPERAIAIDRDFSNNRHALGHAPLSQRAGQVASLLSLSSWLTLLVGP